MGMIRGRIESAREVKSKMIVFGVSPFKRVDGKWVNTEVPNAKVEEKTFKDVFPELVSQRPKDE